ncbi:cysteine proteinase inhibitor 1 [Cajanus cajan]|uniref:Cysteine proteinase inhibitor 5 n=1 Tax=Cajanus cajan TaxID=3821 RepID=A0A151SU55_CAJCA|nr:cysteine proteinase inhibitor 1 [Cajanus cajan]KYP58301.1 Cysteine proteinase inhibitor 5 [Cajanus cajan]
MMKVACLLLVSVVLGSVVATDAAAVGWKPIKNIKDPHVAEIANYAVTEHDRRSGQKLKLQKVVKGDTQVVAGINYRLILAATDASSTRNYEAIVWEKAWLHFRNLTSFTSLFD